MVFLGTYRRRIDDQGRIVLPAKFRKQLAGETMIIARGREAEPCLCVYPVEVFKQLMDKLNPQSSKDWKKRHLLREVAAGTDAVTISKKIGRIAISSELREYASLDKAGVVIILGVVDYLEIWNETVWEKFKTERRKKLGTT